MKIFFVKDSSGTWIGNLAFSSYMFRLLTLFCLGFLVRLVPELIALHILSYHIGFDTIGHYAPTLLGFDRWRLEPFATLLIYLLLILFVKLFDVFMVLRVAACRTPTIRTDTTGLRDSILNGERGFHVPYGQPEAIADKIVEALEPKIWDTLSREAQRWAANFDLSHTFPRFENAIRKTSFSRMRFS